MPGRDRRIVNFGVFEADLSSGELRKSGRPLRLQEQPFRILEILLRRPGEIVTREEFRQLIWGDDVYVDFDRSLNTGIARLREALGDSPTRPTYIETVPRTGYRFIASLDRFARQEEIQIADTAPEDAARRRVWQLLALGFAGVAMAALLLSYATTDDPPAELMPERLTYYEGLESEASFSPDGSQVAFTWTGSNDDNLDIYLKTVGAANRVQLTRHPNRDFSPAWSPDGAWIAFLREHGDGRADVIRVPAIGGREEPLFDIAFPPFRFEGGRAIPDRHLSWSPNSQWLAVVDRESLDQPVSLYLVSASTGVKRRLTEAPEGSTGDRNPAFSADGRHLAFTGSRQEGRGVYLLELTGDFSPAGQPKLFVEQTDSHIGLSWGRDDRELLVVNEGKLWAMDVEAPSERSPLHFAGFSASLPAFSHAVSRLAYTERAGVANIWRVDLDGERAGHTTSCVISSTGSDANFQVSPDGERIVFMSWRSGGRPEIWVADSDGDNAVRLGDRTGGTPRWSPDSNTIVFDSQARVADYDIWTIDSHGGPARPFTEGPADDRSPSWSRDGQWIYFTSNKGAGWQVWKKHVVDGRSIQVTLGGGFYSQDSVDGRFVYYTKGQQDWTVWRVPSGGGGEVQLLEAVSTWNNFAVTEDGIYYTPRRGPDGTSPILFYDFSNESIQQVHLPDRPISNGISLSRDGRQIFYAQIDWDDSDLMLVEGFR